MKNPTKILKYFARNLSIVVGLVMIWRGVWYVLDYIDMKFLDGNHALSGILGILLGLLILYIPDKDLKEISKL
ncbi:MAG: hypothetical protein RBS56_00440 [Candidatus Gracilibacteria bacterium]|jgi:uncharacterized membrane protein HdeD (DUF308 family)|nr:hypothetical protein [Candidatus Gracilibacteria bacterium]